MSQSSILAQMLSGAMAAYKDLLSLLFRAKLFKLVRKLGLNPQQSLACYHWPTVV